MLRVKNCLGVFSCLCLGTQTVTDNEDAVCTKRGANFFKCLVPQRHSNDATLSEIIKSYYNVDFAIRIAK